jgi:hypothetical protein
MSAAILALQLLATAPAFDARAPARLPSIEEPPDPNEPTWYGWQPILADATAACFLGGAFWTSSQHGLQVGTVTLVVGGIGIYLFGGPGLHLARQRPNAALVDVGMRVGFPLGGLLGGALLALASQQSGWVAVGFGAGVLSAILTDAVGLSWEPGAAGTAPSTTSATVRWAPFASAVRGSPVAGLAGTF